MTPEDEKKKLKADLEADLKAAQDKKDALQSDIDKIDSTATHDKFVIRIHLAAEVAKVKKLKAFIDKL